jgi:4-aminobutyrate aminotransferase-like enzyme
VGAYLKEGLKKLQQKYGFVTDVRGQGLLLAMEFDKDIAAEVVDTCIEKGLLINRLKTNTVRFIPPLILTEKEADEALGILDKVLGNIK